jgi:predicted nuclease of predicted toxin-antitoxin system
MKFLVDAQLPSLLAYRLREVGHDALHTLDLPEGNQTADWQINRLSERQQRVVVTNDDDFVDSLLVDRTPYKLLLVSTGNITNDALEALFVPRIPAIAVAFEKHDYIELNHAAWLC